MRWLVSNIKKYKRAQKTNACYSAASRIQSIVQQLIVQQLDECNCAIKKEEFHTLTNSWNSFRSLVRPIEVFGL